MSSEAYQTAAFLSDYAAEVLGEWAENLLVGGPPEEALAETKVVPADRRTRPLVALRGEAQLALGRPLDAWYEVAPTFPRFEFDERLYDLCLRIGGACPDATELIRWLHQNRDKTGLDAPRTVAWICNGNATEARHCLSQARLYRP